MNPVGTNPFGRAVAAAMNSRLTMGPARFHHADRREEVDTVYLGAFPRGLPRHRRFSTLPLGAAEDADFYHRWNRTGRTVVVDPVIHSEYTPVGQSERPVEPDHRDGLGKAEMLWVNGRLPTPPPLAPAILVVGLSGTAIVGNGYEAVVALHACPRIVAGRGWCCRRSIPRVIARAMGAAMIMHTSYGLGVLHGLLRGPGAVAFLKEEGRGEGRQAPVAGSRPIGGAVPHESAGLLAIRAGDRRPATPPWCVEPVALHPAAHEANGDPERREEREERIPATYRAGTPSRSKNGIGCRNCPTAAPIQIQGANRRRLRVVTAATASNPDSSATNERPGWMSRNPWSNSPGERCATAAVQSGRRLRRATCRLPDIHRDRCWNGGRQICRLLVVDPHVLQPRDPKTGKRRPHTRLLILRKGCAETANPPEGVGGERHPGPPEITRPPGVVSQVEPCGSRPNRTWRTPSRARIHRDSRRRGSTGQCRVRRRIRRRCGQGRPPGPDCPHRRRRAPRRRREDALPGTTTAQHPCHPRLPSARPRALPNRRPS